MTKPAPILTILCFSLLCIPSLAQESIGFSDSTDFQYIIDYQLPDWGYSNFYLSTGRFQTTNDYLTSFREHAETEPDAIVALDTKRESHNAEILISPAYQYYRQSEQQIFSLNTSLNLGTGIRTHSINVEGSSTNDSYTVQELDNTSKMRDVSIAYSLDLSSKFYAWNNMFITGTLDGNINFSRGKSERNDHIDSERDRKENDYSRNVLFAPQLGFGVGRVRNVAPQIRAIRLKERYEQVSNQTFTNNEIVQSAEQFTKIQQYKRTRDRHEKYFWRDLNQRLSGKLDNIGAYDLFYLNDVLNENLGQRYEGFDISLRGMYRYSNSLNRDETTENASTQLNRYLNINRWTGIHSKLRWYKNLSLNHQLSFIAEYELVFPLEKDHNTEHNTDIFADFSWLWTITDRYLLTTSLRNYYSKPVFKDRINDSDQFNNETYLTSSFSYFIENRLSLTGSLSANLNLHEQQNGDLTNDVQQIRWSAAVSLRYYFARNLF